METKTLDEVIRAIEVCQNSYVAGKIIKSDALEYLKKLKRIEAKIEKIAIGNVEDTLSKMDNPPLTWDELKGMGGKPVWVEVDGKWWGRFWAFVEVGNDSYINFYQKGQEHPEDLWKCNMGKAWNAFRNEVQHE